MIVFFREGNVRNRRIEILVRSFLGEEQIQIQAGIFIVNQNARMDFGRWRNAFGIEIVECTVFQQGVDAVKIQDAIANVVVSFFVESLESQQFTTLSSEK